MRIFHYLRDLVINRVVKAIQRLSIGWKIFFSFLLVFIAITLSLNLLIVNFQKNSLRNQMYQNITLIIENISKEVVDNIIFFDPLAIDEKISLALNDPGVEYIMLTDRNGKIIGHSNKSLLGEQIEVDLRRWKKTDNDGVLHLNIPITSGDDYFGILRAGISEAKISAYIEQSIKNLKNYIYIISLLSFALTLVLSFVLSKMLIKPLQRLKTKMSSIQADKLELCENPNILQCKDYFKCDKTDCPAYGKIRCWNIKEAKENCKTCHSTDCKECEVFKVSCGDEIGYLIETFNEMIIKLKNSLEELDRATKEKLRLEKSSAMAEMAMTVAHEIKNPLNAIKASTSYLKANFKGEVLREFLTIIDKETERLNELITSFLSYARPVPLKYEKGNINIAIKDVIKLIETEIKDEKKSLRTEFDQTIPEFYFDHHQLKQAVLNLLVNAVDATKEGDIIHIITKKIDGHVSIIIKDTGIGIPDELKDKIFEPFFTTKTTGSGLGLACVERIIKDHEGTISVNSKRGEGTEFTIKIPIRDS